MLKSCTVLLFALLSSSPALAAKSCDELKAQIATGLDARHIEGYSLEIVPADKAASEPGKVVGSCERGSKKIIYRKK